MPTYEYACRACGHQFEEIQKISEPAIDVCPKCGAKAAHRLISQGNFILKGGGWYTTGGYGTPSKEKLSSLGGSSSSSSSESKSESKGETKTETKSETKTETKSEPKKDSSGSGSSGSSSSQAA